MPHLHRADASLTKLRAYLRLCRDLHLLSIAQYGYASQQVAQVGRLLGGWLKSLEEGQRSGRRSRKAVPAS
ncbi:MAG: four helix bundle protein [Delftia sp.]|nr:four helix bundle protein [Delftia sp.]